MWLSPQLITSSFFLSALPFTSFIKNTKDKLPGASAGLMHKETHEVTFGTDKIQKTSCLALGQVLHTQRTCKVTFNIDSKINNHNGSFIKKIYTLLRFKITDYYEFFCDAWGCPSWRTSWHREGHAIITPKCSLHTCVQIAACEFDCLLCNTQTITYRPSWMPPTADEGVSCGWG